jgi:hypothetical protein
MLLVCLGCIARHEAYLAAATDYEVVGKNTLMSNPRSHKQLTAHHTPTLGPPQYLYARVEEFKNPAFHVNNRPIM